MVEQLPVPGCGPGEVLVETAYSLISAGTEAATLQGSTPTDAASRWSKRASKVGELLQMARDRGLRDAGSAVAARLEGPSTISGYSLSGTVLRVGSDVTDLLPGQRVACAGASCAVHAEVVAVPRNLVVVVPEGLPLDQAACVTLGAIALQAVRQADTRLGEIVCVVGLGLVGQLVAALLRAAGCRVVGTDIDGERVERAAALGLERLVNGRTEEIETVVDHLTAGRGADAVVVAAASDSSEPLRQAIDLLRRRGRVVVVGAVGMDIDRSAFYRKDAELRISCSYGPGRYDPAYEERGQDYPYEFVRWTENRNMAEFLRLAREGHVPLAQLLDRRFSVEDAAAAYAAACPPAGGPRALGVLLEYPPAARSEEAADVPRAPVVPRSRPAAGLEVALVGPGCFANEVLLPALARLGGTASLRAVVGRTANSARETARKFGAAYAAVDVSEVLEDEAVQVVIICTRHDTHAELAVQALAAGKAVFLEKPAATRLDDLERLALAVAGSAGPFTLGFNRRFAPGVRALAALLESRSGPLVVNYRVSAGRLPRTHWTLGPQGGGRLIGEACHMIDLLGLLVGRRRTGQLLQPLQPGGGRADLPLGDNFALSCAYADGSVATLTYTSLGHEEAGKERLECLWDGRTAVFDDFRRLQLHGVSGADRSWEVPDKGHGALLGAFLDHCAGRGAEPIPWAEILDVSRFVLELDAQARA